MWNFLIRVWLSVVLFDYLIDTMIQRKVKVSIPNRFKLVPIKCQQKDAEYKRRVNNYAKRNIILNESLNDNPGNTTECKNYDARKSIHSLPTNMIVLIVVS